MSRKGYINGPLTAHWSGRASRADRSGMKRWTRSPDLDMRVRLHTTLDDRAAGLISIWKRLT